MPIGNVLSQVTHAANESVEFPLPKGSYAIVLEAKNERHLKKIEENLIKHGISHRAIREPDMDNSLTAIGLAPVVDRASVRFITKKLRLFSKTTQPKDKS